jgi:tetratricopeptide (TPR) repeat protein
MDWSHDLLSEAERALFARLSVFAGGFTLEAAEQVCAGAPGDPVLDAADVLDLLSQLVDKSLVVAVYATDDGSAPVGPAETRYRLPETVREYGAERLAARGEAAAIRQAHTRYFSGLAEEAGPALSGPRQRAWHDLLEREHDNLRGALRAALDGDDPATALRMGYGLWKFWAVRGHHAEGRRWLEEALNSTPLASPPGAAGTLPRDATRTTALARGNSAAGSLARGRRDYAAARAYHEAALSLWRELDDRRGVAAALGALGGLASDQGDDEGARPLYMESLALRREVGDVGGVALMQTSLGNLAYHRRELPAARDAYREALSRYQELGDAGGEALLRISLGHVLRALGDVPGAVVQGVAGLDGFRALGDRWGTSLALGLMGRLALDQGDAAGAEAYLAECAAILRALEDRWNLAVALLSQARAALALGDPRRAAELNREGLQLALAGRLQRHVAAGLEATAGLALTAGPQGPPGAENPERRESLGRGATLLGAATTLREGAGSAVLPADQPAYEAVLEGYRRHLGRERLEAAIGAGRRLSMEEAVAAALSVLEGLRA